MSFTFIDLFAGIGGFRLAAESLGGKCLGFSEIDKHAIAAYCDNYNENKTCNFGDITKIKGLPRHDFLTAGVPCQSWSIAGKRRGFEDDRGKLWNDTIYLLGESKPKAFLFENVKGLADSKNTESLLLILSMIRDLGYHTVWTVSNALHYGVPQARQRVFIAGFLESEFYEKFEFPKGSPNKTSLRDLFAGIDVDSKHTDDTPTSIQFTDLRNGDSTIHTWDIESISDRQKHICDILLRNRRKKKYGLLDGNPLSLRDFRELDGSIDKEDLDELVSIGILKEKLRGYDFKNSKISTGLYGIDRIVLPTSTTYPTLTATGSNVYLADEDVVLNRTKFKEDFIEKVFRAKKYRKLSKEETLQVQGFPKYFKLPDTRSVWEHLIGNSVSPPQITEIIKAIIKTGVFDEKML